MHAPFVYDFYDRLIVQDHPEEIFNKIESFRTAYLSDQSLIHVNSPGAKSQVSTKSIRTVKSIATHSLSSPKFCRFLYRLSAHYQPNTIIELGTSLGITTLYLSAANPEAKVYSFEGCQETATKARALFEQWDIKNIELIEGNINDTLPQLVELIQTVDLVYIDANHRYQPTLDYYHLLYNKAHAESIFVLDDIHWSREMNKAWKELSQRIEVSLSIDLFDAGVLFFRSLQKKQHYVLNF